MSSYFQNWDIGSLPLFQSTDLTFITNEQNQSLRNRFNQLIKDSKHFDVLVGYFYLSGFHALYKSLESTEKIRILIGISTDQETYNRFVYNRAIRTMHFDEYYVGKLPIKLVDHSNEKLVKRIEALVNLVITSKDEDFDQNAILEEIDTLIYCIYGLNDDEIELVEGKL